MGLRVCMGLGVYGGEAEASRVERVYVSNYTQYG